MIPDHGLSIQIKHFPWGRKAGLRPAVKAALRGESAAFYVLYRKEELFSLRFDVRMSDDHFFDKPL